MSFSYIYRYIDRNDNEIKYVGIVWGKTRTLEDRIREHALTDEWADDGIWKIQFIRFEDISRNDLEALEAHLIHMYGSARWYNKDKADWGKSSTFADKDFEHAWVTWKDGGENAATMEEMKAENNWLRTALSEADVEARMLKKENQKLRSALQELATKSL